MSLADLLKLFGAKSPRIISFDLLFLASIVVDPQRPGPNVRNAARTVWSSVDTLVVSNHGRQQLDSAAMHAVMVSTVVETVPARALQGYIHVDPSPTRARSG